MFGQKKKVKDHRIRISLILKIVLRHFSSCSYPYRTHCRAKQGLSALFIAPPSTLPLSTPSPLPPSRPGRCPRMPGSTSSSFQHPFLTQDMGPLAKCQAKALPCPGQHSPPSLRRLWDPLQPQEVPKEDNSIYTSIKITQG